MKGFFRRRYVVATFMTFAAMGCSAAPANRPAKQAQKAPSSPAEIAATAAASEQQDAQRIWCEYLDALHRRADDHAEPLPTLQQCLTARTFASPKMLRQTAACSRQALEKTDGDPFTNEYAAAVARCGADALDACEAPVTDLEPFVSAICTRMDSCGEVQYTQCQMGLSGGITPHLARAVGAMNGKGRQAFEGCLKKLSCGDMGSQIVECLDPIMDKLLWLPE